MTRQFAGRVVAIALMALAAGCAGGSMGCGFTDETYGRLRKGMTYNDVAQLAGCRGTTIATFGGSGGPSNAVRWPGPGFGKATTISFEKGVADSWIVA